MVHKLTNPVYHIALCVWVALGTSLAVGADPSSVKRPVDICILSDVGLALVVCEQSGEVIAIDTAQGTIVDSIRVANQPVAVERMPDGRIWVVAQGQNEVIEITCPDRRLKTGQRISTVGHPHAMAPAMGNDMLVAGLWSRQVACIRVPTDGQPATTQWTATLNFSPRSMRVFPDEQVVLVADAFGSQIAFLDGNNGKHLRQVEFYGHNLHGFIDAPDGQRLIVSHQMLNSVAHSTSDDIHWGTMMSNDLRWLDRKRVLGRDLEMFHKDGHIDPIGVVGHGAADPNDVVCAAGGMVVVPLGGTNEVAIGKREYFELARVPVGINPVAVALDANDSMAWVVNRLDDSISKIQIAEKKVTQTIRLSAPSPPSLVQQGERLFHDASLSHDGWMSCASCHPGGHAINEAADNLSDGSYRSPKRVLSLLGRFDTAPFGWLGKDANLEGQLQRSVHTTMRGDRRLNEQQLKQLIAFLETLPSPPSMIDPDAPGVAQSIDRGAIVFREHACHECHQGPKYTSDQLFDVGIEDEVGNRRFNPPSLLGVGQRGPRYFHALQADSLADVFTGHQHGLDEALSQADLDDLLIFLNSL